MSDVLSNNPSTPMKVSDVAKTLVNVLKFRRKTTGSLSTKTDTESVSSKSHTVRSLSVSSTGAADNEKLLSRRNTLRGITQSFTALLRLNRSVESRSKNDSSIKKTRIKFENTYKLEADTNFNITKVNEVVSNAMEDHLERKTYDYREAGNIACNLSTIIKTGVKDLNFPRYRIVCHVIVVQAGNQGMEAASKFLWSDRHDNYTCVTYRNESLCAVAMVYGIYMD